MARISTELGQVDCTEPAGGASESPDSAGEAFGCIGTAGEIS